MSKSKEESVRQQAGAWEAVFDLCLELGMKPYKSTGKEGVLAFIRELHRKAQAPKPSNEQG